MSTTLPHGIIQINEGNIAWYGDITANWQLIDGKIGIYDAAIATIPAPANNGALTINYGGTTIAMFGADNAGNVSADIPAPGDGTLTVTQGGSTLGSFTANQAAAETIDIPAPGNGTLTIRLNGVDVQTFTANQANDVVADIIPPVPGDGTLTIKVNGATAGTFTANASTNATANITVPTKTSDLTNDSGFITSDNTKIPLAGSNAISGSLIPATDNSIDIGSSTKNIKTLYTKGITIDGAQFLPSNYVPRSGGPVMTGEVLARNVDTGRLSIFGGSNWNGSSLRLFGADFPESSYKGCIILQTSDGENSKNMAMSPNGTWTWEGTACQITSDQRLKQQIAEIDDKLLDAWQDVELAQFKYNDAVDQKKDKARLHTGYVVQQIDEACKSHNVDISQYGLYCHEEYPQEVEEVEVEQADGTKVKEKKIIREASEHYSLRYTEVYAVECMYLRRCIARLTARIEELEKGKEQEAGK